MALQGADGGVGAGARVGPGRLCTMGMAAAARGASELPRNMPIAGHVPRHYLRGHMVGCTTTTVTARCGCLQLQVVRCKLRRCRHCPRGLCFDSSSVCCRAQLQATQAPGPYGPAVERMRMDAWLCTVRNAPSASSDLRRHN